MTSGSDKYIETVRTLGKLYDFINKEFFNSELDKPVIAISPDVRNKAKGWFTLKKVWKENELDEGEHEINISANFLNRPLVDICETIIHEMCHYYASVHNIQDCSRSCVYHNKCFKQIAEKHGLSVELVKKSGWSQTSLTDDSKAKIEKFLNNDNSLNFYRIEETKGMKIKSSITRKYVCPVCGQSVRATKEVNVICGDCDKVMQEEKE
ncbi:MAG: SprT-like domain-containing protein [Clostridiales bacterium]|jgi:hypothetical protein|nr:SprT-like domain-containing protein [Clostridiales bacterium]